MAVASLSLSLATDVVPPVVARTGLLLRVLLAAAPLVKVLLLAVEIKAEMVVREVTTTEALEETLATDLKEARATVAAQETAVIRAMGALGASLVATQPEDRMALARTVLVKEVTEQTVEAARVVPTKEVRIRALRDRVKVISPDVLEQLARLPSAWVSRLRPEA